MNRPAILAMVLAGGRVDELGVLTHHRPKSAVPFGGFARVIDFALSNLLHSGIPIDPEIAKLVDAGKIEDIPDKYLEDAVSAVCAV